MRVGAQLWIGEEDEGPAPRLELGMSRMDPCDRCGSYSQTAWFSAAQPGTNTYILDLYLCRACLEEAVSRTIPAELRYRQSGRPATVAVKARERKRSPERDRMTPKLRFQVLRRDGYRCQICGATTAKYGVQMVVDHKVPIARGGTSTLENLWTLCHPCNAGKSDGEL